MIHLPATSPFLIPSLSDSSHHSFDDPLSPVQRSLGPVGRSEDLSFDMAIVEDITDQATLEKVSAIKTTVLESSAFPQAEDLNALFLERQVSNGAELPSTPKVGSLTRSAFDSNEEAAEMIAKELVNWRSSFTLVDDETIPTSSVPQLDSPLEPSTPCVVETTKSKKRKKQSEDEVDPDFFPSKSSKKGPGRKKQERDEFFSEKIDELISRTLEHDPTPFKTVAKGISSSPKNSDREHFRRLYQAVVDCLAWETEHNTTAKSDKIKKISQKKTVPAKRIEDALKKARIPENRVAFQPQKKRAETIKKNDAFFDTKIDELIAYKRYSNPIQKVAKSIGSHRNPIRRSFRRFYNIIVACLAWETENNALVDENKINEISKKTVSAERVKKALERARIPENRVAFKRVKLFDAEERNKFFDTKIDELIAAKHLPDPFKKVSESISNHYTDSRRENFRRLYKAVVDCLAWETEHNMNADADKIKEISKKTVSAEQVKKVLERARIPENRVVFQSTKQRVETTKKKSEAMESSASSKSEQATIAQKQGASENQHSDARLTLPESDSASCSGIDKLLNEQLNNRN